jgi:hypothetical protein
VAKTIDEEYSSFVTLGCMQSLITLGQPIWEKSKDRRSEWVRENIIINSGHFVLLADPLHPGSAQIQFETSQIAQ